MESWNLLLIPKLDRRLIYLDLSSASVASFCSDRCIVVQGKRFVPPRSSSQIYQRGRYEMHIVGAALVFGYGPPQQHAVCSCRSAKKVLLYCLCFNEEEDWLLCVSDLPLQISFFFYSVLEASTSFSSFKIFYVCVAGFSYFCLQFFLSKTAWTHLLLAQPAQTDTRPNWGHKRTWMGHIFSCSILVGLGILGSNLTITHWCPTL